MKSRNNLTVISVAIAVIAIFFVVSAYQLGQKNPSDVSGQIKTDGDNKPAVFADLAGTPVPEFSLKDINGKEYSSENLKGKNYILFFNEGLMCYPACWNQIVALAEDKSFEGMDVPVFSVVVDRPSDWQQAINKMPELGDAKTLFDTNRSISKLFGVLSTNSSMHFGSLPGHSYVLVNKEGIIKYVYDDPRMAINNDLLIAELQKIKVDNKN